MMFDHWTIWTRWGDSAWETIWLFWWRQIYNWNMSILIPTSPSDRQTASQAKMAPDLNSQQETLLWLQLVIQDPAVRQDVEGQHHPPFIDYEWFCIYEPHEIFKHVTALQPEEAQCCQVKPARHCVCPWAGQQMLQGGSAHYYCNKNNEKLSLPLAAGRRGTGGLRWHHRGTPDNKERLPAIVLPLCSGLGSVSLDFLWHRNQTNTQIHVF